MLAMLAKIACMYCFLAGACERPSRLVPIHERLSLPAKNCTPIYIYLTCSEVVAAVAGASSQSNAVEAAMLLLAYSHSGREILTDFYVLAHET